MNPNIFPCLYYPAHTAALLNSFTQLTTFGLTTIQAS